nr:oxidoreductase [Pseudopedobacter sp.]
MNLYSKLFILALVFYTNVSAQSLKIIPLDSGKSTTFRGLSVVNQKIAWASGSNGWIAKTIDGEHFDWQQIKGFEKIDFRSIKAFSSKEAMIVGIGSPAYILKTIDGGISWVKVYENSRPSIFLDGIEFLNKNVGFVYGDPINGLMTILKTTDGGGNWENISEKTNIKLFEGEASFAASGTGIRAFKNKLYIISGGTKSRLFISEDGGSNFTTEDIPILQGQSTQGAFSMDVNKKGVYIVGGDYTKPNSREKNYAFLNAKTYQWETAEISPLGHRSCIVSTHHHFLITTGDNGTDYSVDGGRKWMKLSDANYYVIRKGGNYIYFVGPKGKIAKLKIAD